jgi:hypothetical protein
MTPCQSDPDANEAFASHFARYAERAGREALVDAAEAEDDPQELIRFAKYQFDASSPSLRRAFSTAAAPFRISCPPLREPCGVATPARPGSPIHHRRNRP